MKRWPVLALDWANEAMQQQLIGHLVATFNDPEAYGLARIHWELQAALAPQKKQFFFVAEADRVLGVAGAKSADWASKTWILYMSAVVPEARGQGIGRCLVEARLRWIKTQQNHGRVLVSTGKPKRFRAFGFRQINQQGRDGRQLMLLEY